MTVRYYRGVNDAGGDFGIGAYGGSWGFDSQATLDYLASRGHKLIRLPFLWENAQPTLGDPLDATFVTEMGNVLDRAQAAGLKVIPDLHNYCRYTIGGTQHVMGDADGVLTPAHLSDFWTKFSAQFKTHPAIWGYGLMNEPHDLPGVPSGFIADATLYDFEADLNGWKAETAGYTATHDAPSTGTTTSGPNYYSAFGLDTLAKMQDAAANGVTAVVIQAYWDRLQSAAGGALSSNELTNLQTLFDNAATAGLDVIFEAAIQYPPTFVKTNVPQYKDQNGNVPTNTNPGFDVRDWVWSATGWSYVQDFVTKVWNGLSAAQKAQIIDVRVGGGINNELQFPDVGGAAPYSWWGFSDPAQTGTDLAPDQMQAPSTGYIPFSTSPVGTAATTDDIRWVDWYTQSIRTRMLGYIDLYRNLGYTGDIHVLHPSFGFRSNYTDDQASWREQKARGCDWNDQIAAYAAPGMNVYPHSTWLGGPRGWNPPSAPSDYAAWEYLWQLANTHSVAGKITGENTGGQTDTDMNAIFTGAMDQAATYPYKGLIWLNYGSLTDGTGDTMANYASNITAHPIATTADSSPGFAHDGTASLKLTGTAKSGYFNVRANDNSGIQTTYDTTSGSISCWVYVDPATPGTDWTGGIQMQNSAYQWQGPIGTRINKGTWTQLTYTPDATTLSQHRAIAVQLQTNSGDGSSPVTIWVDTVERGNSSAGVTPAQQWEQWSQDVVDALRSAGDATLVSVPGYQWASARFWLDNHPAPWITDSASNVVYEGHFYPDDDSSGQFNDTYATEQTNAVNEGYTSVADRASKQLANWLNWLDTNGVTGFLGEFGWRDDEDTANWNAVGEAIYAALDAHGVHGTFWATGERWGVGATAYKTLAYYKSTSGGSIDSAGTPASVIEAHLTLVTGLTLHYKGSPIAALHHNGGTVVLHHG